MTQDIYEAAMHPLSVGQTWGPLLANTSRVRGGFLWHSSSCPLHSAHSFPFGWGTWAQVCVTGLTSGCSHSQVILFPGSEQIGLPSAVVTSWHGHKTGLTAWAGATWDLLSVILRGCGLFLWG